MQNFRNFDALLPLYFFTMEGYSLMDLKEILEQYKEKLVIGENTYAQVLEELRNFINLEQIPQSNVSQFDFNYVWENCVHCAAEQGVKPEELEILIYKVQRDNKSKNYYDELYEEGDLLIIIEDHIGFLSCESPSLFQEIDLAKGVSRQDIEQNTSRLEDYLSRLLQQKKF